MHQAAEEGNVEDVRMYLENLCNEKNPGAKIEGGAKGKTPMHTAAQFGHLNVIQIIETATGISNPVRPDGISVLHTAAQFGHLDTLLGI